MNLHHVVVIVPCALIISESHYTSLPIVFTNQGLFEKYVCIQSTENTDGAVHPRYNLKLKYTFSVSYVYPTRVNHELFEEHLCNQGSQYKKYG